MQIFILDTGILDAQWNSLKKIEESVDLCQQAEELNFSGYYIAEHQSIGYAWHTPEIILTILGMSTSRIRLGIAGLQFNINMPLKVAQQYKLLNSLFDDRIDVGIGKAAVNDNWAKKLIENPQDENLKNLDQRIEELYQLLNKETSSLSPDQITIEPIKGNLPAVFMMGNSEKNMSTCLKYGFNLAVTLFHRHSTPVNAELIRSYKTQFKNKFKRELNVLFAIAYYIKGVSNSDERLAQLKNEIGIVPMIYDTFDKLREDVQRLNKEFGTDGVILLDLEDSHSVRKQNLNSIANLFKL